ncbi:MAG: DUF1446 domain-containing protein [Litoricolaceae bacterium]|nr:DUF1446 domain-containing protein [Litorivicinaceae bacterium]
MPTKVLIPSGVLGLGFHKDALWRGIESNPDLIAIDGGSTDSGPFYLGTGTSKYSRSICRAEWREIMMARASANVPLIIGTCGTCGTASSVDWMFEITCEIAQELGQSVKITRLYSDIDIETLKDARDLGQIRGLEPAPPLDDSNLKKLTNIVALAGAEQICEALATGADIILAGRTTDTAIIAALPLLNGADPGAAWHGAKIAECGAFCTSNPASGTVLVSFDEAGFLVEAMGQGVSCSPQSVSAHMLYENADPFVLFEPGGYLDVRNASYNAIDNGLVRVEGSRWVSSDIYTVKLEGAMLTGFQTTMLAIIRDARYVSKAEEWAKKMQAHCQHIIASSLLLDSEDYCIDLRLIGLNAALGDLETQIGQPIEVGVMITITAESQALATEIALVINPHLLHYPLTDSEPLPTFAFPFSPVHSERGPVYEFALNHVLELETPMKEFYLRTDDVSYG